jgi:hypothetical protein
VSKPNKTNYIITNNNKKVFWGAAGMNDFQGSKGDPDLSLANWFGPDPPFRVVMDGKAIVSLGPTLQIQARSWIYNSMVLIKTRLPIDFPKCENAV